MKKTTKTWIAGLTAVALLGAVGTVYYLNQKQTNQQQVSKGNSGV